MRRMLEIILVILAILSLLFLVLARTVGSRTASRSEAVTRIARPGIVFWGESVDVELDIDSGNLPACPVTTTVQPIYAALVLDRSGSMAGAPILEARNAASDFVDLMNLLEDQTGDAITVVAFNDSAYLVEPFAFERGQVVQAIQNIGEGGGTDIASGLNAATAQFIATPPPAPARRVMILLSDGQSDPAAAIAAAEQAKTQGLRLVTIALGDADRDTLSQIVSSPTDYYETTDPATLLDIYSEIAEGLVGTVATSVTLEEYFDQDHFALTGRLYRAQQDTNNHITWRLPFVGQRGRSVGYLLQPTSLGWHRISPTPGRMSLTDCQGQSLAQVTPLGPRILVLFPAWVLYTILALTAVWLLYRLIQLFQRPKRKSVTAPPLPPPPPPLPSPLPPPPPPSGEIALHKWWHTERITLANQQLTLLIGEQTVEEAEAMLRANQTSTMLIRVEKDGKSNLEVGSVKVKTQAQETFDIITGAVDKRREIRLENFSTTQPQVGKLILQKVEAIGQRLEIDEISLPPVPEDQSDVFKDRGYQIRQNKQGKTELFKSLSKPA